MDSRIAGALGLKYNPVAILWSDEKPGDAGQFMPGKWGCVMAALGATASRGRVQAFDRQTYGCWGGGVGLGFGNAYLEFPGGLEGFYRFLSNGNARCETGRAVAERCAGWMRGRMLGEFLHGEGYLKNPELTEAFVQALPITDVPSRYVVFKPLSALSGEEEPRVVVFFVDPDQLSAMVVLASYGQGRPDATIIPWGAGCQTVGIFAYREAASERPRAVVGLTDLSARNYLRRLGRDLMTVALPYNLFRKMEEDVPGSFLDRESWKSLRNTDE